MDKANYTTKELAERWQTTEITLRRKLESGSLPGFKVGRSWLVTAATVNAIENNILPNRI